MNCTLCGLVEGECNCWEPVQSEPPSIEEECAARGHEWHGTQEMSEGTIKRCYCGERTEQVS